MCVEANAVLSKFTITSAKISDSNPEDPPKVNANHTKCPINLEISETSLVTVILESVTLVATIGVETPSLSVDPSNAEEESVCSNKESVKR